MDRHNGENVKDKKDVSKIVCFKYIFKPFYI